MKSKATEKLILSRSGDWSFDHHVSLVFDTHIRKSIPCYVEIQNLIAEISKKILSDNDLVYDLGTATGEIIYNVFNANEHKNVSYVGIDNSGQMLKMAKQKCSKIKNATFYNDKIEVFDYETADLIIAAFTIQFTEIKTRKQILKRIKDALKSDGTFIFCEKISFQNFDENIFFQQIHEDWKSNYFSNKEIKAKRESLKNVMEPMSLTENIELLRDVGFKQINVFFQWCNFVCILAK